MRVYWYAPRLRPPAFGGMPREPKALPVLQRMFPGQRFHAWAYAERLPAEVVERFDLALVEIEFSGGESEEAS